MTKSKSLAITRKNLQPKADQHRSKNPFGDFRWISPYVVEDVLPKENYIFNKSNTNKTKVLHRIRIRKYNTDRPLYQKDIYTNAKVGTYDNTFIPETICAISLGEQNLIPQFQTTPNKLRSYNARKQN